LTLEAWVWPTGVPGANGFIVAWDGAAADYAGLLYLTTQKFAWNIRGASLLGTTVFPPQAWYHVVGTFDNTTARLYVNGTQDASVAVAGAHTYSLLIGLGGVPTTGASSLQACISDVAIYSTALSAARVSAHFSAVDQRSSAATYIYPSGNGAVGSVGGGNAQPDLSQVLASVRKTYVAP